MELAVNNDYPEELKKQLSRQYLKGDQDYSLLLKELKDIFDATEKEYWSLDDIIVAYWKTHNRVLKRASLSTKLASLAVDGKIEREGRSLYKLP